MMSATTAATIAAMLPALLLGLGCDRSREVEASPPSPAAPLTSQGAPAKPPGPSAPAPSASQAHAEAAPAAPERRTFAARSGDTIVREMSLDSHLMVERDVGVTTRRDGVIETVLAERGQRVTEGLPLAVMDRGDLLLSEKTAELELAKEQSSFDRALRLSELKVVSDEEFELARLRRDAAEKSLQRIRYELEKCFIRAPFDGVVSGRFVEKGQVIQQDDRKTLFQVTALSPLLARVYLPEWALFGLREGQGARVASPTAQGSGPAVEARVRWINDVLDAASGSVEVLVEILDRGGASRLRPGMSVKVLLELSLAPAARGGALVSVPREVFGGAEPASGQQVELGVLAADGTASRRDVIVGFVGDTLVEIRSGLSPGEKVLAGPPLR